MIYIHNFASASGYYVTGTNVGGKFTYVPQNTPQPTADASYGNSLAARYYANALQIDTLGNLYIISTYHLDRVMLMGIDKSNPAEVCTAFINAWNSPPLVSNVATENPSVTGLISTAPNFIGNGWTWRGLTNFTFDMNNSIYIYNSLGNLNNIVKLTLQ